MNERTPYEPKRPSDADLHRVWFDNVRNNQIGGATDGITPDIGADIGYLPPPPTTEQPDEPIEGATPLFPENDDELDAAVGRHPANPQPANPQTNKKSRKPFSGPVRGDSEGDTGNPAYHEPYNPLTDEEKSTGKAWVVAARRILEQNRSIEDTRGRSSQTPDQDPSN